jgi:hypothetical protein
MAKLPVLALVICLVLLGASEDRWVPARWTGGPLELALHPQHAESAREAIANWYNPATLDLLEGTPINCLLMTFGAMQPQQELVKEYARLARERDIRVLGLVYPGTDLVAVSAAASTAGLDGLVLDGVFPEGVFTSSAGVVIPIAQDAASARNSEAPLVAVKGVRPSARDLAEMGIRAGPSSEPWIDSNIWLVRSFQLGTARRAIWVNQEPDPGSVGDYTRCVADAAVAGGQWIITLDDELRTKLYRKEPDGLATWRAIGDYLRFAKAHAEWRDFAPYGNLGIILDTTSEYPEISNEYLNLVARRQVPYRIIERRGLSAGSLEGFRAVLAADLAPPTDQERKLLRAFAGRGGLLIGGPSWGDPPKEEPYIEAALGQGRVVVYKDEPPDPEQVARDLLDLLDPDVIGVSALNVPSVLTYASTADSGKRLLVQLLNYAGSPFDQRITIRVNGRFETARLYTPESEPVDLAVENRTGNRTQAAIPKLAGWGAILFQ